MNNQEVLNNMMRELLPPEHPDSPKYWMCETSGVLEPAVLAYLHGDKLSLAEIGAIKAYLRQWVNSPVWAAGNDLENLRTRVAAIQTYSDIHDCISRVVDLGMDPL